jgi:hypothetical protein
VSTEIADKILAECAIAFQANSDDCNRYLKAVAAVFFEPDLFTGPGMNADAIVAELRANENWEELGTSHASAIGRAQSGQFVVAAMTSSELGSSHGHLAIVVGDDGQKSGTVLVPICYAGSLNAVARVERRRISETFGAKPAREGRIRYFCRSPQTIPELSPVTRLVDCLRGVRSEPAILSVVPVLATESFAESVPKARDTSVTAPVDTKTRTNTAFRSRRAYRRFKTRTEREKR